MKVLVRRRVFPRLVPRDEAWCVLPPPTSCPAEFEYRLTRGSPPIYLTMRKLLFEASEPEMIALLSGLVDEVEIDVQPLYGCGPMVGRL